jgi:hypothetical protein
VAQVVKAPFWKFRGFHKSVELFQDFSIVNGRPDYARKTITRVFPSQPRKRTLLFLAVLVSA